MHSIIDISKHGRRIRTAFAEHKTCMRSVYALAEIVVQSPGDTPDAYAVTMGKVPSAYYSLRKNLFSVLFMSVYPLLDIPVERRLLYGKLNHLFRAWVTSADNLLDNEQKVVMPLDMPGSSHVMREIVSVMAADRVLSVLLNEAVADGVITEKESRKLLFGSLQVLLPSAGQEGSEEQGVKERPSPEHVLSVIHRYKTGLLFHIPLMGPEHIEAGIELPKLNSVKNGLMQFGLGCQLLDDVRDMGRDLRENRHNYALSQLFHDAPADYRKWQSAEAIDRLYRRFPVVALPTARRGLSMMRQGLMELDALGLGITPSGADAMAQAMFTVLDLGDLEYA